MLEISSISPEKLSNVLFLLENSKFIGRELINQVQLEGVKSVLYYSKIGVDPLHGTSLSFINAITDNNEVKGLVKIDFTASLTLNSLCAWIYPAFDKIIISDIHQVLAKVTHTLFNCKAVDLVIVADSHETNDLQLILQVLGFKFDKTVYYLKRKPSLQALESKNPLELGYDVTHHMITFSEFDRCPAYQWFPTIKRETFYNEFRSSQKTSCKHSKSSFWRI